MKILFVEDNLVTSKSISKLLTNKGYRIICTPSLDEALTIIEKEARFTHLVCDYDLNGENGLEAVKAFTEKFPTSRVMIFTGHKEFSTLPEVQNFFLDNHGFRNIKVHYKPIDQNDFFQWFSNPDG